MTKLSSKASGCVEAAIGLGPEDTSRIMELHQLYADAGLSSDQAIRKAANDLVAELQEEAADITRAVAPMLEAPVIAPADAAKADAAIDALAPQFSNAPDDDRLIAVHNLTEANLLHAAKMGGIAVPSLAVTPAAMPLDNFGEITLLAPKSLVDPKAGAKVFGADIYSPRYPSVERELDRKQIVALRSYLGQWDGKLGSLPDFTELERDGDRELSRSLAMQAQFLADNGIEPGVVMRKIDLDDRRIERLKSFGLTDAHLAMTDRFDLRNDPEFEKAAVAEQLDAYRQAGGELSIKLAEKLKRDPEAKRRAASDLAFEVVESARQKANPKPDEYATRGALEKQIDEAGLRDAYAAHVAAWLDRITKSERIYQGFTDSGNRKYTPHTLDNVVKILKKNLRGGESFNYGVGSVRALVTPEFKSIAAIKAGRGRLVSVADFDKVKAEIDKEFSALGDSLDLDSDGAKDFLEIAATRSMLAAERELDLDLTTDQRKAVGEFMTKLRGLPTAYFEAKQLRAVGIDEFAAAVIPAKTGDKARKVLADAGVRVFEYDKTEDRAAAVTEATREAGVQFSNIGEPTEMASAPVPANAAATKSAALTDHFAIDGTPGDILWSQTAYHGGPHRGIEKFSTDKIGTGEGAQAYGWGLYVASKEEIAEWYRRNLTDGVNASRPYYYAEGLNTPAEMMAWRTLMENFEDSDYVDARDIPVSVLAAWSDRLADDGQPAAAEFLRSMDPAKIRKEDIGQLYKVEIPDDTDMLLWDKPLSEQPEGVRRSLKSFAASSESAGQWVKAGAGWSYNVNGLSAGMVFQARGAWFADPMIPGRTAQKFGSEAEARAHLERTTSPDQTALDGAAIYAKISNEMRGDRAASEALMAAGIKGIKYLDGTSRRGGDGSFNYVIFSGDDVAIKEVFYSNQAQFAGRDLPAETRTQKTRRVAQDYFLRTKVVQDFVIGQGGTVGEAQDVYRAEERSYGRVQAQLEDFAKRWVQPMLEKAAKAGIEMDELALYAYAKHAPERNTYIDKINPAMNGAGSGMSDADAAKIVADVQASGKAQAFEDLRQDLLAITETTRQVLLQDGLITQDEYDAWTNAYQDYVPLRGLENVDDEGRPKPGVGRGVNIRGKESVAALGRRSRAGDVIENIVRDYERAVIRGERNNVAKTFLDLVTTNPDPDLWEVNAQKTNRTLSKATGLVQMSTSTDSGDDTVGVKVAGQQLYIKVKDPLLLRAMRQAAKDETGEFQSMLAKSLGVYNNWLRNTLTRYNPVFGAVNAVRDLQAGAVATLDKLGAQGLKLYSKHYRAALAASVRNEFDALGKTGSMFGDPVMDKWFDEYRRAGGTTAGWFLRDVEDIHTDIRQMMVAAGSAPRNTGERITGSVAWQAGKSLLKYVELFGSASENAGRVAAYRAAREMGRSPAEAASIAKNLTTNFNRKGEWGTALSSAYLFFNAAVQGTARVLEALKNRRVQALMGGVSAMAATLAVMGAEMGGDDDDGQAYWDKIPDYEKERNLIIMLPPGIQHDGGEKVGEMGRYIKVPMPYGFNVFAVLGYTMADAGRYAVDPMRGKSPAKLAINLVSAVAGSYNPMGGAFDVTDPVAVGMAVAPTIVDAGIQLGAGVNSFGTPVGPKGSPFDTRPDSERFTVSQGGGASQRIARWVNENTGGNRARSGAIDVMPGTIDNVVSMAGGGTGKFLFDVFVNMPTKLSNDESVFRYRDLPFLRNFAGQVDENVDRGLFYERMDEVLKEARAAKNEMKMGIAVKYDPRSKAMQSIGKMADDYSGLMTDLRKEDLAIVNDPSLTAEERKSQRKDVERRRNEFVREFNRAFLETERDLARGSFDKE